MEFTPCEKELLERLLEEKMDSVRKAIEDLEKEGGEAMRAIPLYQANIELCKRLIKKLEEKGENNEVSNLWRAGLARGLSMSGAKRRGSLRGLLQALCVS